MASALLYHVCICGVRSHEDAFLRNFLPRVFSSHFLNETVGFFVPRLSAESPANNGRCYLNL